jgi:RNA polymerase sigma-70 factor (ECF subfamily)
LFQAGYNIQDAQARNQLQFQSFTSDYLERLKQGDPVVGDHFSAYFRELIYLKCRWRVSSTELLEDIQQETLLRVLGAVERGAVQHPERFGAFVNSVCNNVAMELIRKAHIHEPPDCEPAELADLSQDLEAPLINEQHRREVESVLAELTEKDRGLLRATFLEEKSSAEVCHQFKVDGGYLRVLVHRAKQRFKKVYVRRAGGSA